VKNQYFSLMRVEKSVKPRVQNFLLVSLRACFRKRASMSERLEQRNNPSFTRSLLSTHADEVLTSATGAIVVLLAITVNRIQARSSSRNSSLSNV
jgi:hypothetical protein